MRVADDVGPLLDLNLVEYWDVDHVRFAPRSTATHKEQITAALQVARGADKDMFRHGTLAELTAFADSLTGR